MRIRLLILLLLVFAGIVSAQDNLNYGDTVTGQINAATPQGFYTFTGQAGDLIQADVLPLTASFQPDIALLGPEGLLTVQNNNPATIITNDAGIVYELPNNGLYSLVVTGSEGGEGQYLLSLQSQSLAPVGTLSSGQPLALTLQPGADAQIFSVPLNPGVAQRLIVNTSAPDNALSAQLLNSTGQFTAAIGSTSSVQIPAGSGNYLLVLGNNTQGSNVDLSVILQDESLPALSGTPQAIASPPSPLLQQGQTIIGSLDAANPQRSYPATSMPDGRLTIQLISTTPGFNPVLTLSNSAGTVETTDRNIQTLAPNDVAISIPTQDVEQYTVTVSTADGSQGQYVLAIEAEQTGSTIPLADNQLIQAGPSTQSGEYVFSVPLDPSLQKILRVDRLNADTPYLASIFDADGALVATYSGTASTSLPIAAGGGEYLVRVVASPQNQVLLMVEQIGADGGIIPPTQTLTPTPAVQTGAPAPATTEEPSDSSSTSSSTSGTGSSVDGGPAPATTEEPSDSSSSSSSESDSSSTDGQPAPATTEEPSDSSASSSSDGSTTDGQPAPATTEEPSDTSSTDGQPAPATTEEVTGPTTPTSTSTATSTATQFIAPETTEEVTDSSTPTVAADQEAPPVTSTLTPTYTVTSTYTLTPTYTATSTYTPSYTPTVAATATYTPSYTPTSTNTTQPTATYTPSYTPTTPPPQEAPPDSNYAFNINLDTTASILDFVSYPGGDTEDRVSYDVRQMNPNVAFSGGQARLVISASCFGDNVDQIQFFSGGQTYGCGQTIVDREVTFDSNNGSITITAVGGQGTYVQWVLTGTATRIN